MISFIVTVCLLTVFALAVPLIQVCLSKRGPITRTPLMRRRLHEAATGKKSDFSIDMRWVDLDEISPELVKAAIAVEDWHFITHHGIPFRSFRWMLSELYHTGKVTRGESTITNQTARNVFLTIRKHYWRKAYEYYYSLLMELFWGKRRIMEVYLNVIEMGDGVFGCEAAARHHFGKHASELSRHESALLAVSLRNPRRFTPRLFSSGTGWWTEHIASCEWACGNWSVPADGIWNLKGDAGTCYGPALSASLLAGRLKRIALERKTVYRPCGIGSPTRDGGFAFDCSGLIKSVLWGWKGNNRKYGGARYRANGVPDINANRMIETCRDVSTDFSNISVGELVWLEGHVGIYVGDGLAVESTPAWKNGVQLTACNCEREGHPRRDWTKHGKFPYVDYARPAPPASKPSVR